jgi:tetratricopeptide (TPR) repeat protein
MADRGLPLELIREALDRGLSPDQRAKHRLDAAEGLLSEPVNDARRLEDAARSLEAAGEVQRAAVTYERAARARQKSARPERTVPLMIRALTLVPLESRDLVDLGEATKLLADSLVIRQQHEELENVVRRIASHVFGRRDATSGDKVDTLLDLARALRSTLHYVEAQQMLLRTEELVKGDEARLRKVRLALADTQIALGDFLPAIKTLDSLGLESGDDTTLDAHEVLVLGAHAHAQAQNRLKALSLLKRADALVGPNDHEHACRTAQVRALAHALAGDWEQSAKAAGIAAAYAEQLGLVQQEISYRHYEGEALTHLGENARAYAAFRSSLDLARDAGAERWVNRNRMLIAFLEGRDGSSAARKHVGECLALAERQHHTQDVAKGRLLVGQLLQAQGDPVGAQRELQLARQIATSIGHALLVLECEQALKTS